MALGSKNAYIETFGCSANQNNSEIMAGILGRAGFLVTNNPEIAEIIIINTCIVKSKTESKIKRRIQDLRKDAKTKDKLMIIAGCMPETDFKKLKKLDGKAIFLGTHHFKDILNLIRDFYENKLDEKKRQYYLSKQNEIKLNLPKKPQNPLVSIHQISEGCLGNCSFCKARLAKGMLFSYPKGEILKSIESDLQNGAKEIWLTSQDNAAYGMDRCGKSELPDLLKEILSLKHKFKLRLGMMNPNNVLPIIDDLIGVYKDKKMFKFLHIPIQSASNKILKDMNRFYTIEQAESIKTKFKKDFPEMTISTDIIVGYPTETGEDYQKNVDFLKDFKPDILNLSKFSSHKETLAGKLKVLSNSIIIRKRTKEIMQVHRETARQAKQKYLNRTIKVLVDKKIAENLHQARDENYNLILVECGKENLGREIEVEIKKIGVHSMVGWCEKKKQNI